MATEPILNRSMSAEFSLPTVTYGIEILLWRFLVSDEICSYPKSFLVDGKLVHRARMVGLARSQNG